MAGMIFFTDNYQDRSTNDGYQFEFFCRRCGNGYSSSFQHSATGFGGRMLRLAATWLAAPSARKRPSSAGTPSGCATAAAGRPATRRSPRPSTR